MILALRHPQTRILWLGQALSSIGDEIYRVGLIWLAVESMGADTGYLAAGQTFSLLLLSFFGGKWADHWDPRRTMISVDLIRALLVLIPVVVSFFMPQPLAVLWIMAFCLSGLCAFFDPATQGLIPLLAKSPELVKSTNGLMSTTIRMARMVGPSIVGLLSAFVPMIHFFTIDALTFLVSACCVYHLKSYLPEKKLSQITKSDFRTAVTSGFKKIQEISGMQTAFFCRGLTTSTWNLVLVVAFPLFIHRLTGGNPSSFGFIMASYGLGNFIGALYFGNHHRKNSWLFYYLGQFLYGFGFIAIAISSQLILVALAAAYSGFMGPMNDLAFIDMIQQKFKGSDTIRMFRLRLTLESGMTLVLMLISPWLIRHSSVETVILGCGLVWIFCGLIGLVSEEWGE